MRGQVGRLGALLVGGTGHGVELAFEGEGRKTEDLVGAERKHWRERNGGCWGGTSVLDGRAGVQIASGSSLFTA